MIYLSFIIYVIKDTSKIVYKIFDWILFKKVLTNKDLTNFVDIFFRLNLIYLNNINIIQFFSYEISYYNNFI